MHVLKLCLLVASAMIATTTAFGRRCTRPNQTSISYHGDGGGMPGIYDALVTCPNITSLDLDLTTGGCVVTDDPWLFQFREGDRFPALQKLSVSSYDFDDSRRQRWDNLMWKGSWQYAAQDLLGVVFPQLAPQNLPRREPNLEKWVRAMDFTQMEKLHLDQGGTLFYERMKHELPGLRRLSIELSNSGLSMLPEHVEFLRTIPALESLSISIGAPYSQQNRTRFPVEDIVEVHGQTLHSLSLHQTESHDPDLRRTMLSPHELSAIGAACPNLTHLSLDLDRNASYGWPNATIDALMQLPNLTSLNIGLEIGADLHDGREWGSYGWNPNGLSGGGPFREPRISLSVSETLFADLRGKKRGQQLQTVEFVVGDFGSKPWSGPIYMPSWEEGRGRMFVCRADDVVGKGESNCEAIGGSDPFGNYEDAEEERLREEIALLSG